MKLVRIMVMVCGVLVMGMSAGWGLTKDGSYEVTTKNGPDAETGGWFINLGITGARGKMTQDAPRVMEVAYVFKGTPADGVLQVGDRIVGVNGKRFREDHKFGYGMDKFGYEGPIMDIGHALEESQGPELDGKLSFDLERDGVEMTVEIILPTEYGQFSETYPFDCAKTDRMLAEMFEYLADRQRDDGSWTGGRVYVDAFAALALLASGDSKYKRNVEKAMRYFADRTNDEIDYGGYDCWKYGLWGVALAEYYLATEEKWVLDELDEINRWLVLSQFDKDYRNEKGAGGWGHRPKDKPGGNGYGPICMITAQAFAAWGLIGQCGLEVNRERYDLAQEFLEEGTNNIGYVWYADGNAGDDKYADMGRTGASAVAHAVSPFDESKYRSFATKSAECIGENFNTFIDTHGSPLLGLGWTALGAAQDEDSFRSLMDEHVWHFNLSHCPDGTFYYQPNRDNNPQDYTADARLSATATTALVMAIKYGSLRVMGGEGRRNDEQGLMKEEGGNATEEMRTFYSADGDRSFEGILEGYDAATEEVTVRMSDGRVSRFPLSALSEEDRAFVLGEEE
ncbi:MAG: DUF6288 domain-containing protein [Verrucomicrobiota bacterium]